MNRGHNREMLFRDAEDCHQFLALLGRYRERFDVLIYHYCVPGGRGAESPLQSSLFT
jgi:hypothetical protein